jgi:Tfp pilus assembly protein PilF
MEEHQVAEAQPLLERAIAINPIYWKPYYNLALCYQEQGQPVEARAMYERAMQVRQQTQ